MRGTPPAWQGFALVLVAGGLWAAIVFGVFAVVWFCGVGFFKLLSLAFK